MEDGKFLSDADLVRIELQRQIGDFAKLEIERAHLSGKYNEALMGNHARDIEILKLKNELLKAELKNLRDSAEAKRDTSRKFMLELRERYELPEKWGFNPESGEIILE